MPTPSAMPPRAPTWCGSRGVGFFDSFPAPPPVPEPPPPAPWFAPPRMVFGGPVPQRLVLVHTESALVFVDHLLAFPTGLEFTTVVARRQAPDDIADPFGWDSRHGVTPVPPPEILRLGIVFSDGEVASNLLDRPRGDGTPRGPVLRSLSGYGGRGRSERRWWLWPLPPAGPVRFVVEWPAERVTETSAEVDGDQILAAAAKALVLEDW